MRANRGSPYAELAQPFTIGVIDVSPALDDLVFSNLSFPQGSASPFKIADITGKSAGTTLSISPNDGRLAFNAGQTQLLVGLTASSVGTIAYTVTQTETSSGATHSQVINVVCTTAEDLGLTEVGPHSGWVANATGVAGSGRGSVAASVRTTAKPRLHWWTAPGEVFVGKRMVAVYASAKGGIQKVQFSGDLATTDVTTRKLIFVNDVNGNPEPFECFAILVDEALFTAVHPNGAIHIYAEAFANDGSMQTRVIGGAGTGTNWTANEAYEMTLYPRATRYTWDKTIGAGGDYANWYAMTTAYRAHCAATSTEIRPRARFISNATIEIDNRDGVDLQATLDEHVGYFDLGHYPGVTATFQKSTFDPYNGVSPGCTYWCSNWTIWLGIEQLHIMGAGIQIDQRHAWDFRVATHRRVWFDGMRIFNSAGTDNLTEINGSPVPGFACSTMGDGSSNMPIVTNVLLEFSDAFGGGCWMLRGIRSNRPGTGRQVLTRFMANNRVFGATCRWWLYPTNRVRMSLRYDGSGEAVAKIYAGPSGDTRVELWNGPTAGSLTLTDTHHINASLVRTVGTIQTFTELVAAINDSVASTGWTAVQYGDDATDLWPRYLGGQSASSEDYYCAGITQNISCQNWIHSEWGQFFGDAAANQNYVFIRNVNVANFYATGIMNNGGGSDVEMSCNIFDRFGATDDRNSGSGWTGSHSTAFDNIFGQGVAWYDYGTRNYNESRGNILNSTPGDVLDELYADNLTIGAITSSNVGSTGNVTTAGPGSWNDIFINRQVGFDYRAAPGGLLATTLRPVGVRCKWDINGLAKNDASDIIGPLALASPGMTYPWACAPADLPINNLPDAPPVGGVDGPIVGQRWNKVAVAAWPLTVTYANSDRTTTAVGDAVRLVGIGNVSARVYWEHHIDSRASGDWIWLGIMNAIGNTYPGNDGGKGLGLTHFGQVSDSVIGFGDQLFPGGSPGGTLYYNTGANVGVYVDRLHKKMWWTVNGTSFLGKLGYTTPHPDNLASGYDISAVLDQDTFFAPMAFAGVGTTITSTFYEAGAVTFALPVVASYNP